jgi:hypothetical protein
MAVIFLLVFLFALFASVIIVCLLVRLTQSEFRKCADCGCLIDTSGKREPPDGWQLADGRTVCGPCCAADTAMCLSRWVSMGH